MRSYDPASPRDIERFAKRIERMELGDATPSFAGLDEPLGTHSKGLLGRALEHYFGIPPNNAARPDFPEAGVELKTVPLAPYKDGLGGYRIKERTKVCAINFQKLLEQTWKTSDARHKLEKVLFVFILPGKTPRGSRVEKVLLWDISTDYEPTFESDWCKVYDKVAVGLAHCISEGDGKYLGASTAGAGGGKTFPQPKSSIPAKMRAFSLKPPFTRIIYLTESIRDNLHLGPQPPLEAAVLRQLHSYAGRRISDLAAKFEVPRTRSYHYCARVIRRALGAKHGDATFKELHEAGIQVKSAKIGPKGIPFEAMSFPAFKYDELVKEDWETSSFRKTLQNLLIVPMTGGPKGMGGDHLRILGKAFFWHPTPAEWDVIRREWEHFVGQIRTGKAKELTTASKTEIIHVRPHAEDSSDTDMAPVVGPVVKKCFWLNKPYIAKIVAANSH